MLNTTQLVGSVKEILQNAEYRRVELIPEEWSEVNAFVFEDKYSIVAVVVYETCSALLEHWRHDQGTLVRLISKHVSRGEAKAAEGYLVLLTGGRARPEDQEEITEIRYDTSRVRKLVSTGQELEVKNDVKIALSPLLPLGENLTDVRSTSALNELPEMLDGKIPKGATLALIEAYDEQKSLMEALNGYLHNQ